jgi:hypothetical protein
MHLTLFAGMGSWDLTDVAKLRLQSISFFLVVFLLSALLVQLLWNYLRKDFAILPRLGYGKALGVVALWGLLFVLVLSMISGARELLTPGAWEKQDWAYRLKKDLPDESPSSPSADLEQARKQKLNDLRIALWAYARSHNGRFPSDPASSGISTERWLVADASGMRYLYVGGLTSGQGRALLAWEPDVFGPWRYALFSNGDIQRLDAAGIALVLQREKP